MKIDIHTTTKKSDLDPAIHVLTLNLSGRIVRVIFPDGAKWDHYIPRFITVKIDWKKQ